MCEDEFEEDCVDVGPSICGFVRCGDPLWARDAIGDGLGKSLDGRPDVGFEEAGVNLT